MRPGILVVALTVLIGAAGARAADTSVLARNHPAQVDSMPSAGVANPNRMLSMQVRLALRNQAELERLLIAQHDPASPDYRRWLSVEQFNRRFGARQADADAIAKWLANFGLTIKSANAADGFVAFSGTVAQAQRAFAVNIARFGAGRFFANTNDPAIPARLAGSIETILGMDNMALAMPTASVARTRPQYQYGAAEGFGPGDLYTFYDETPLLQSATGSDGCIAIVGVSDISDAALSGFDSQFGLPDPTLTRVGTASRTGDLNEVEAELDVEWSHAAAPGAPIVLYLGSGKNSLVNAITAAVNENRCGVISVSFAYCGAPASFYTGTLGTPFKKAAATGQSVFVSSGDQGAAGSVFSASAGGCVPASSGRHPSGMASNPNVVAVGGTSFVPDYNSNGNDVGSVPEGVWNDSTGASGGGISPIFGKPSYQRGVAKGGGRGIPDVALIASPDSPGAFMDNEAPGADPNLGTGITCCIGGTSLATPVWAGFARVISQSMGERIGNINFEIYPLAKTNGAANGFRDVTQGDNSFNGVEGFSAQPGYDLATGWGTVDVSTFANAFQALPIGKLTLAPRTLNFGRVTIGQTSAKPRIAKLINSAANHLPAQIAGINITANGDTPAGAFNIDNATTTCASAAPAPGKSCAVGVSFSPPSGSNPGPMSATLSVTDNATNTPQTITLRGIAK